MSEQSPQMEALDRARDMMRDRPELPNFAATFRLAAFIEAGLRHGWSQSMVDSATNFFDELELSVARATKKSARCIGSSLDNSDRSGEAPDEAFAGEAFVHELSPVAGLDTATVGQGGEAVTASPPSRPASCGASSDAIPDCVVLAVGRAEIERRRADGVALRWTVGRGERGFSWADAAMYEDGRRVTSPPPTWLGAAEIGLDVIPDWVVRWLGGVTERPNGATTLEVGKGLGGGGPGSFPAAITGRGSKT